ncbi:MAG: hypothetical protein F4Z74_11820 [Acidobacteria bacterium]|nr:hypothetical protein [Acidobacteriota bacterium]MYE42483.1 hypothetical protein [Acidobacteriota bacterium]
MNHMTPQIRVGVGVAFGFAAGAVLANVILEGKMGWVETASLGLELIVGGVIGFAVGRLVGRAVGHRLSAAQTPAWVLLSFVSGCVMMVALLALFWNPFNTGVGAGVFGVWNGLLLGAGFRNQS